MVTCFFLTAFSALKQVTEKRHQEMAEGIELSRKRDWGYRERESSEVLDTSKAKAWKRCADDSWRA